MAKQVQIKRGEIPQGWSTEAADFINRVSFVLTNSCFKESQRIV
jgi:hypothetical protein